jgi:hypothetical protein
MLQRRRCGTAVSVSQGVARRPGRSHPKGDGGCKKKGPAVMPQGFRSLLTQGKREEKICLSWISAPTRLR